LHDRLFREASLNSTDVAVGFILNTYALPRVANLLEPLNEYLEKNPIDDFENQFSQGFVDTMTFDGKIYGIPMRAAPNALWYNEAIFKEAGLPLRAPETPEEFVEFARKATFKRADGSQVYGYGLQSHYYYTGVVVLARMWDGDFIDTQYNIVCNQAPMVKAMTIMQELYAEGVIPPNVASIQHAEIQRMAEQGILAMGFSSPGKSYGYNVNASMKPIVPANPPMSESIQAMYPQGPPTCGEYWAMVIPKNSAFKDEGWDLIKKLSSAEGALAMALNGNSPLRASVFEESSFTTNVPYAPVALAIAKNTRVPLPAFDKSPQAMELIDEYIELCMFGKMAPQAAMDKLAEELVNLSSVLKMASN
jgi:multiple sugar transport system substrate-binding protein